ncbi:lytic transglycosylase domain-containing protein [Pelagerythrobacter aerophilus]|uniref:Lytic transglycosylase domain-containing protein n=1 Tax=Pelagerythrobacter aerophilus TaxID=2306995 RepID=A0A418NL08_9SPHN|nr:lytic transglycosylase domain-containing protein [Pelagerythrobacter aerophilus]RIV80335.1 lytic transglycosylase domain-containing protein [Pelagerythrobacter aerophilus]
MARLSCLIAALALIASSPAAADPVDRWRTYIAEAAARFDIPGAWIERVMRAESGGRTTLDGRPIASHAGAMGLMQLMPGTWAEMRASLALGSDPHDPRDNILAGAAYLRRMYDRFGYPGLFAAYNAGPARYAEHLTTGRALPQETRAYLTMVGAASAAETTSPQTVQTRLFFLGGSKSEDSAAHSATKNPSDIFVVLSPGAQTTDTK